MGPGVGHLTSCGSWTTAAVLLLVATVDQQLTRSAVQAKEAESVSDLKDMWLEDLPPGSDYEMEANEGGKKLVLNLDKTKENAIVMPKKPLFNSKLKVEECGGGKCKGKDIAKKVIDQENNCYYTGNLRDDPNSRVNLRSCAGSFDLNVIAAKTSLTGNSYRKDKDGVIKKAAMVNFTDIMPVKPVDSEDEILGDIYDKMKDGNAYMDKSGTVVDMEEETGGSDYSDKGGCCRARKKKWVRTSDNKFKCTVWTGPLKCGDECHKLKSAISKNAKSSMDHLNKKINFKDKDKEKKESSNSGGTADKPEEASTTAAPETEAAPETTAPPDASAETPAPEPAEESTTVAGAAPEETTTVAALAEDSPGAMAEDSPGAMAEDSPGAMAEDSPGAMAEDSPGAMADDSPGAMAEDSPGAMADDSPGAAETEASPAAETEASAAAEEEEEEEEEDGGEEDEEEEEDEDDEEEEEEDGAPATDDGSSKDIFTEEESGEEEENNRTTQGDTEAAGGAEGSDDANKNVKDMAIEELKKIREQTESYKKKETTTTQRSMFRSRQIIVRPCAGCPIKEKNPDKKIYTERTIEVGVVTDMFLWNNLKEAAGSDSDEELTNKMIEMVHSLMISTETYLLHNTISAEGGFHVVINGLKIIKDDSAAEVQAFQTPQTTNDMLTAFQKYGYATNEAYDGYEKSYDMLLLLTGKQLSDVPAGTSKGLAYTGQVCSVAPCALLTLKLEKTTHQSIAGLLLAHEMGHLLGSDHDGSAPVNTYSIYKGQSQVPCPIGTIMSPTVSENIKVWSECTQKMVDAEYKRRSDTSPESGNCFFT